MARVSGILRATLIALLAVVGAGPTPVVPMLTALSSAIGDDATSGGDRTARRPEASIVERVTTAPALRPTSMGLWRSRPAYRAGQRPAAVRIVTRQGTNPGRGTVRVTVAAHRRTLALTGGAAHLRLPSLPVGRHRLTATYRPSPAYRTVVRTTWVWVQDARGRPALPATPRPTTAPNFRDVAGTGARGYRTASGRYVARGVLYRSGVLDLSAADAARLRALDVRRIWDLRSPGEVRATPDRAISGARRANIDVFAGWSARPYSTVTGARAAYRDMYRSFVSRPAERRAYARLLRSIAATDAPQVIHCQGGKDRTGWASALLLSAAGVPRSTIRADYLATNTYTRRVVEARLERTARTRGAYAAKVQAQEDYVRAEYLQAAFDEVAARYGTMDAYLTRGLGLTRTEVDTLRERLLT